MTAPGFLLLGTLRRGEQKLTQFPVDAPRFCGIIGGPGRAMGPVEPQ
ncbi:MAG: hypothetical protein RLY20_2706 [Verrucomicrobiota bacterium]|jgi:hypothetical protein